MIKENKSIPVVKLKSRRHILKASSKQASPAKTPVSIHEYGASEKLKVQVVPVPGNIQSPSKKKDYQLEKATKGVVT